MVNEALEVTAKTVVKDPFGVTEKQRTKAIEISSNLHTKRTNGKCALSTDEEVVENICDAISGVTLSERRFAEGCLDQHWANRATYYIDFLRSLGFRDSNDIQCYLSTRKLPDAQNKTEKEIHMTTKFQELCETIRHRAEIVPKPFNDSYFGIKVGIVTEALHDYIKSLKGGNQVVCRDWEGDIKNAWVIRSAGFLSRDQLMPAIQEDLEWLGYKFPTSEPPQLSPQSEEPQVSFTLENLAKVELVNDSQPSVLPCPIELLPEPLKSEIVGNESWVTEGGARVASAKPDDDNIYDIGKP